MAHQVFLSHSSKDRLSADAACHVLERNGVRVWIAPRDIIPGTSWARAIVKAIEASDLLVLIHSSNANISPQVEREVELAINNNIPVIPVRIENVRLNDVLKYFISSPHWLDVFDPPLEQHLERLVKAVKQLLQTEYISQDYAGALGEKSSFVGPRQAPYVGRAVRKAVEASQEREEETRSQERIEHSLASPEMRKGSPPLSLHPLIDGGLKDHIESFVGGTLRCHCPSDRVEITVVGDLAYNHACGCSKCWKPRGAALSIVGIIPSNKLQIAAHQEKLRVVDATATIQRHACVRCGVHMFGRIEKHHPFKGLDFIHPELFDNQGWQKPQFAAFVSSVIEQGFNPDSMNDVRLKLKSIGLDTYDALSPNLMDAIATYTAAKTGKKGRIAGSLHPFIDNGLQKSAPNFGGGKLRCHCMFKKIEITVAGDVVHNHVCGCSACWRPKGAAFAVVGVIPASSMKVTAQAEKLHVVNEKAAIRRHADLPPIFHPAAVRACLVDTPSGADGATGDRRSWAGLRSRSPVAVRRRLAPPV